MMKEEREILHRLLDDFRFEVERDKPAHTYTKYTDKILDKYQLKTKKLPVRIVETYSETSNYAVRYRDVYLICTQTKQEAEEFIEKYGLELISSVSTPFLWFLNRIWKGRGNASYNQNL